MENLNKYFFHGAIGLIFGQAVGLFISILFMGIKIMPVLQFTAAWGIFGFYTGTLWNKGLKFGALGIVSGILVGIVWYTWITPLIEYMILPGILFSLFLLVSALLKHKLNIKNMLLFSGIAFSVILISVFIKYSTVLENKFTGVIPPLIGFFSFLISLIILGGLICIGFYYLSGGSGASKSALNILF